MGRAGSPATFGGGGLLSSGGSAESIVSSWAAPTWSSIQGLASSFLSGTGLVGGGDLAGDDRRDGRAKGRATPRKVVGRRTASGTGNGSTSSGTWGPEPPGKDKRRPRLDDVAVGAMAKREAALKAMKTASVLESHEGVNGGLDVSGRFKKRRSDEDLRSSSAAQGEEADEHLVYVHLVQPSDTYAGIVLKYRCREDAFRKANGLWSRDNTYVQVRKWLALPVDACEVRGRPCEAPSYYNSRQVDLLAPTPDTAAAELDDPFASTSNGKAPEQQPKQAADEERPWTHVRWVTIDSFTTPVEIARVPRKALGYFPPRRKKSLHTVSRLSTPRGSLDVPHSISLGSEALDGPNIHSSPASTSSRRMSLLSGSRSVGDVTEHRPAWMLRPGGVGSLHGKNARAPGPERDYFNSWAKKHLPSLNIEALPSMSVMGAESARFAIGEAGTPGRTSGIVESPFEEGRDVESLAKGGTQGSGLDKAAAAVETWLRGAFAKIPPGTPVLGPRGRGHGINHGQGAGHRELEGDLIELADTNSDDGRGGLGGVGGSLGDLLDSSLLSSSVFGSSSRSEGDGSAGLRGRGAASGGAKGKKAD